MFELELSWVGEFTNGVHQRVSNVEAEKSAKSMTMEDGDNNSDEDMD